MDGGIGPLRVVPWDGYRVFKNMCARLRGDVGVCVHIKPNQRKKSLNHT